MSFRARLTTFFVLIVVVPMIAMGVLMFRLIDDSQQGKADARASGLASTAGSLYQSEAALARGDAETLARAVGPLRGKALTARFAALAKQAGLSRATLSAGTRTLVGVGSRSAIAPGAARSHPSGRSTAHDRDGVRAHRRSIHARARRPRSRDRRPRGTQGPQLDRPRPPACVHVWERHGRRPGLSGG